MNRRNFIAAFASVAALLGLKGKAIALPTVEEEKNPTTFPVVKFKLISQTEDVRIRRHYEIENLNELFRDQDMTSVGSNWPRRSVVVWVPKKNAIFCRSCEVRHYGPMRLVWYVYFEFDGTVVNHIRFAHMTGTETILQDTDDFLAPTPSTHALRQIKEERSRRLIYD